MRIRSILGAALLAIAPVAIIASPAEAVLYTGSKKVCAGKITFYQGSQQVTKDICSTVWFDITDTKKFKIKKSQTCIANTAGYSLNSYDTSYRGINDISTHWRDVVSGVNFHSHGNGWTDKWCWVDGQNDSVNVHQATSKSGYVRVYNRGTVAEKGPFNDTTYEHFIDLQVNDYL